jgi:AcrR family transcriptional regulator
MSPDPLVDTLFRSTVVDHDLASALPVRAGGTRSRAGNAMSRTRAALIEGARRCVLADGTHLTMSQVAEAAGVAKATLYNHFRTRSAVLHAVLDDEVGRLVDAAATQPLPQALESTALAISEHPLLRSLATQQPGTLVALGRVDASAGGWRTARVAVVAALAAADRGGVDLVLRWLASHVVSPATRASIAADVEVLLAALPSRSASVGSRSA